MSELGAENITAANYERKPPRNIEQLCGLAREVIEKGRSIVLISDFDKTKSKDPVSPNNPFQTILDPECAQAEKRLADEGVILGTISNRGAGQIVKIYNEAGFENHPFIVGTYGAETMKQDNEPEIDKKWGPYSDIITGVLRDVRERVFREYGISPSTGVEVEIKSDIEQNPIYLEMKGIGGKTKNGDVFAEGLAHTYNFNQVPPEKRAALVRKLDNVINEKFNEFIMIDGNRTKALMGIWGDLSSRDLNNATKPGNYSYSLEPSLKRNKGWGMTTMLRAIKEEGNNDVGLVLYAGDHPYQDSQAMYPGRVIERNGSGLGIKFVGIIVKHDNDAGGLSDFSVNGVNGYGKLLRNLADAVEKVRGK